MILNVYAHYNKKIDCFTQPILSDVDPDKFAINEERSLMICDLAQCVPYKNLELYVLGCFDDLTGQFILEDENGNSLKRKLCEIGDKVIARIANEKGVKEDELESVPIDR